MKPLTLLFITTLCLAIMQPLCVIAQPKNLGEVKARLQELKKANGYLQDTTYASVLNQLAFIYALSHPDSAIAILANHPQHCNALNYTEGEAVAYKILGTAYQVKGNFPRALVFYEKAYKVAEKGNKQALAGILNNIGLNYFNQGNYSIALTKFYAALKLAEQNGDQYVKARTLNNLAMIHFFQGRLTEAKQDYDSMLRIAKVLSDTSTIILAHNNIGELDLERNELSKAKDNFSIAYKLSLIANREDLQVQSIKNLGYVYYKLDSLATSIKYFEKAYDLALKLGNLPASCKVLIGMANTHYKSGMYQNALSAGLKAVELARRMGQAQLQRDANQIVASTYEAMGNGLEALKYYKFYKTYADSLNNKESQRMAANLSAEFGFSKKELEFEKQTAKQRWIIFSAVAGLFSLLVIVWIVNRNKEKIKQANTALHEKNKAIENQKTILEDTLATLNATQSQLVQSEKMASLGQLTAGIAHEIQNPLNFVNNFSEVSKDLLEEMKTELKNGNNEDAIDIADDVIQNLDKINHHGKRADSIVKGMLQHSRSSSGQKESTDINKLTDEYLRLAYHGLRAKDKSFNATLKTDYDEAIGNINIIPQEIGRVILNLLTNAFYAAPLTPKEGFKDPRYKHEPTVWVKTAKIPPPQGGGGGVLISVRDNGPGIPQNIIDKIFQPFFTTKPTGQGTGLGLSLAYDIVKAHGGELKVESRDGEGSEFTILLPG